VKLHLQTTRGSMFLSVYKRLTRVAKPPRIRGGEAVMTLDEYKALNRAVKAALRAGEPFVEWSPEEDANQIPLKVVLKEVE